MKCPGPYIIISCAEGILFRPSASSGLFPVTGSLSLLAIKNGLFHDSKTSLKAFSFFLNSLGIKYGKICGPALYVAFGYGASYDNLRDKSVLYTPPVNEGDIMIVPQFLMHYTTPNPIKFKKRILSFDFVLEPVLF